MNNVINKVVLALIVALSFNLEHVSCQYTNKSQAAVQLIAEAVYGSMSSFTYVFKDEIKKNLGFCVVDV